MLITPVDQEKNLFRMVDVFPQHIVDLVANTDWINLAWRRQEGQERWLRRRINDDAIPWLNQWNDHLQSQWTDIEYQLGCALKPYVGTAFWLDEPGFICDLHTDGELPGSMHLTWKGAGTSFYWHKNVDTIRYSSPAQPNAGYVMINQPDNTGYRRLLWHAMLNCVPENSFRLTSYTWLIPE